MPYATRASVSSFGVGVVGSSSSLQRSTYIYTYIYIATELGRARVSLKTIYIINKTRAQNDDDGDACMRARSWYGLCSALAMCTPRKRRVRKSSESRCIRLASVQKREEMAHSTTRSTTNPNDQRKPTYSRMAQHFKYPTRDDAIILDSIAGISIHSYTIAVGSLVQPRNVRFVSRISMNRVCIYLSDKILVRELSGKSIDIEGHRLTIRPLVSQAKRILLSNVCPVITYERIIEELQKLQIVPVSPITFVRAGTKCPGYEHVCCFRRQMYVKPSDLPKIPPRLEIQQDNIPFTLYLSSEKLTCFLCKEEGHIAKNCRSADGEDAQDHAPDAASANASDEHVPGSSATSAGPSAEKTSPAPTSATLKRSASSPPTLQQHSSQSDTDSKVAAFSTPKTVIKPTTKRFKYREDKFSISDIKDSIKPATAYLEKNRKQYPLNVDKLVEFLSKSHGAFKIYPLANEFTYDTDGLMLMLTDTKQNISCKNLKARLTRLIRKLSDQDARDQLSDSSCTSNSEI
ncbi:unnamed protein product [Trichogramma brassicae]|uniref:CCHC-type domain-containing protein n=1 Tax=Trichogramma brassicae TaxID=86971 RepID=A0A6H5J460_9HYME|nr:unnamed protein product [Trichogramma brassicae]